ncbi:MAG: 6-carboxytetrahydropterin synthase QueD [Armatimonadota bacterium]
MYELTVESQFDSAHNLRGYEGPCESLHGHTYRVQVCYKGSDLNELGILVDFKKLRSELKEILAYLDHRYLNELPEFHIINPTAENIAKFVYQRMRSSIGIGISLATVWETPTSSASYWEEDIRS